MENLTAEERLLKIKELIEEADQIALEVDGEVPKTTNVLGVEGLRKIYALAGGNPAKG